MVAVRALQRRVVKLEAAGKPRPSPFASMWGSFDNYVVAVIWPGIHAGALSESDMLDIIDALRRWEGDGTWERVV
jgi:hypothetical protein